jgi:hypothetical protein
MRTSISKYLIAGLAGLSLTASAFATTEPAAAGYEYQRNAKQAGSVESSVSSRPTSPEGAVKLALGSGCWVREGEIKQLNPFSDLFSPRRGCWLP